MDGAAVDSDLMNDKETVEGSECICIIANIPTNCLAICLTALVGFRAGG